MIQSYKECRDKISTGDVVFFKNGTTLASKLTQFITRSPFYHVGIAFWVHDPQYEPRLLIVEAHTGGRRIVSLSSYVGKAMSVLEVDNKWMALCDDILDNTGAVPYGYSNYVQIGLKELFGLKPYISRKISAIRGEVCSELTAKYLRDSGLSVSGSVSPGELYRELVSLNTKVKFEIQ
jgi:hypothetical protein